jgi:hypothetical protein
MSTRAIIRFCTGNEEVGALLLFADGYPNFVRDRLLIKLNDERWADAEEAMEAVPNILAAEYNYDIFDSEKDLERWSNSFKEFESEEDAIKYCGSAARNYTVHVVDGICYF